MTLLMLIIILLVLLLGLYAYLGGFSEIKVSTQKSGGETIVYQEVTGDYKQTKTITNKIYYYLLHKLKIEANRGIGIFYDNPKEIAKDKLRSEIGCIIESKDTNRLSINECIYKIKVLPSEDYATAELPLKNGLSIFIGFIKVYPALDKYISEQGKKKGSVTEIYDIPNRKIIYRQALLKCDQ